MEFWRIIYVVMNMVGTVIIFWLVMSIMIEKKKIALYLPFYGIGIYLFIATMFNYLGLGGYYYWGSLELFVALNLLWVYFNLGRLEWK